jgi:hypothetical protein
MSGAIFTGQHITYAIWAFTAFSVLVQWRARRQPHAASCRCDRCRKHNQEESK